MDFKNDPRFTGIEPFDKRVWLASPTMHGEEQKWVEEAIQTNWVSTIGANINEIEKQMAEYIGCKYAVALSAGTAALHLATKLAGEKLYGRAKPKEGTLAGQKVFCSDVTFIAAINPVAYEDGEAVFIDIERDTWNMSPEALEKAFALYPEVRLVVFAHLYGTPGKMDEIKEICDRHHALIVEDAVESLGSKYKLGGHWVETGTLGDCNCISFNGNKIITGSAGGMFLTDNAEDAAKVRKWSTQSREDARWYQHEEIGYNYRMSNIIAGIVRGQIPYLDEHIEKKRQIWERYKKGLADLPVSMNPWDREKSIPNFWLSSMTINPEAMVQDMCGEKECDYRSESGMSSPSEITSSAGMRSPAGMSTPSEILDALAYFGAEGRPIWKPMHMQPLYKDHAFVTVEGDIRSDDRALDASALKGTAPVSDALKTDASIDVGADIFRRGLCLPSDIKMTEEQQDRIIEIIHRCFK